MPDSGLSISDKDAQERVTLIPDEQIAAVTPRNDLSFIYSTADGIQDHVDLLDNTNVDYWTEITSQLRTVLEAIPPTATLVDPGDSESIPFALLDGRGYLDIGFSDAGGSTPDQTSSPVPWPSSSSRAASPTVREISVTHSPVGAGSVA